MKRTRESTTEGAVPRGAPPPQPPAALFVEPEVERAGVGGAQPPAGSPKCPVCLEKAVPPVVLDVCGHTMCAECMRRMRDTVGDTDEEHGALRTGFRCPNCRRLSVRFIVSEDLRKAQLIDATEEERARDAEFMCTYRAELERPADPTTREIFNAHVGAGDVGGGGGGSSSMEVSFEQILQSFLNASQEFHSLMNTQGEVSVGGNVQVRRVTYPQLVQAGLDEADNTASPVAQQRSALERSPPLIVRSIHQRIPVSTMAAASSRRALFRGAPPPRPPAGAPPPVGEPEVARSASSSRSASSQPISERVAMLETYVPQDLRMWETFLETASSRPTAYYYTLHRALMDASLQRAFYARMRERGVRCRRVANGYRLTLLASNRHVFANT